MTEQSKSELFAVIRDYMNRYHGPYQRLTIERKIREAHNGRPDGTLVTTANLGLFRQYRNAVSPSPAHMVDAALAAGKVVC